MDQKSLLVADNNRTHYRLAIDFLGIETYKFSRCDVRDSLDTVLRIKPDGILLELFDSYDRPYQGVEELRRLKSDERNLDIPVIVLTKFAGDVSYQGRKLREICRECRAVDYIEKPYSINKLRESVEKHIGHN